MHADLDTLCTVVYCTADDLLPERPGNARCRVTDAEVATLCVAQAIMGIPSDRRFLAVARKRLRGLFPQLPKQPGFHKRRARLAEAIEWLIGVFAAESPASTMTCCSSTRLPWSAPVRWRRRAARRSPMLPTTAGARRIRASSGAFACTACLHSDGTPRAFTLASPKRDEREVGVELLQRAERVGGEWGVRHRRQGLCRARVREAASELDATIVRPARRDEPESVLHLAPIR